MGFKHTLKPGDILVPPKSKADAHAGNAGPDRLSSDPPDNSAKSDSLGRHTARLQGWPGPRRWRQLHNRLPTMIAMPTCFPPRPFARAGATPTTAGSGSAAGSEQGNGTGGVACRVNPLPLQAQTESGRPVVPPSVPPAAQTDRSAIRCAADGRLSGKSHGGEQRIAATRPETGGGHPDQARRQRVDETGRPRRSPAASRREKSAAEGDQRGFGWRFAANEQEQRRALRSGQRKRQDLRRLAQAQAGAGDHGQPGRLPGAVRMCGPGSHERRHEPPLLALPPASQDNDIAGRSSASTSATSPRVLASRPN